jgi:CBS-domain-containing membrane protein
VTWREYFRKMKGTTKGSPPRVSTKEIIWSWGTSFLGIAAVAGVQALFFTGHDFKLLIGSFGASSVLVYGAIFSPLAQPRNLVGGHMVSAFAGVLCWKLFHAYPWLAEAMAVSLSIAFMHITRTLHPPGGATGLIAVIGSDQVHKLGFLYVLMPVAFGALILLFVAVVTNNLSRTRRYPEIWF